MLRKQYIVFLRRFFSREVGKFRAQSHLTQEKLSEQLCMAPRSYASLEHGKSGCSGLTLMLFLLLLKNEEVIQLLDSARKELGEVGQHDAA